jgi:hypothetical protein
MINNCVVIHELSYLPNLKSPKPLFLIDLARLEELVGQNVSLGKPRVLQESDGALLHVLAFLHHKDCLLARNEKPCACIPVC